LLPLTCAISVQGCPHLVDVRENAPFKCIRFLLLIILVQQFPVLFIDCL